VLSVEMLLDVSVNFLQVSLPVKIVGVALMSLVAFCKKYVNGLILFVKTAKKNIEHLKEVITYKG
jgi:RNAse (barnase) inhibitor barstar